MGASMNRFMNASGGAFGATVIGVILFLIVFGDDIRKLFS
jgi:hypothetical protein